jgi:hypothetical protein
MDVGWSKVVSGILLTGCVTLSLSSTFGQAPAGEPVATASSVAPAAAAPVATANQPAEDDDNISDNTLDPASLLPDLPSLRSRKTSLIGGTIQNLDRIRDRFTLQVFGGGKMKIAFDPRTHIYRDGAAATASDLHRGDRVSVDTTLDGSTVFARNIRLKTGASGESQGIVIGHSTDGEELIIRDPISPRPLKLHITSQTRITDHEKAATAKELVPGTLVALKFSSQKNGNAAEEVSILANPGSGFTFVGRVTSIDIHAGMLVLSSESDGKSYEIFIDPSELTVDNLRQASDVTIQVRFHGNRYVAQNVTVN